MEFSKLKNYLDKLVSEYKTPGVDCVVYKDHIPVFRYFTGKSDIDNNVSMTGKEEYYLFSMSKMITCTAALQLYEQGKYLMSDNISTYLPEFKKMCITTDELNTANAANVANGSTVGENTDSSESGYAKNQITVRDLFTMGAGLDYNIGADFIKKTVSEGKTSTREIVGSLSNTVLGFEPGTRFRYSLCHDVLGALIEIWSGQSFGDYLDEHIFKPLGMTKTFFATPQCNDDIIPLYTFDENGNPFRVPQRCVYQLSDDYQSGGAGLCSCTEDYATFLDALACGGVGANGNRILSSATVELMGTNHLNEKQLEDFSNLRRGYGYGLGVRVHMDKAVSGSLSPVGEFGWDGAAGAFSMVDTKNKLSLTYFQQIHGWDIKIQMGLRNALYAGLD